MRSQSPLPVVNVQAELGSELQLPGFMRNAVHLPVCVGPVQSDGKDRPNPAN